MASLGIKVDPSLSNESIASEKLTSQLIDLQKKGYLLEAEGNYYIL